MYKISYQLDKKVFMPLHIRIVATIFLLIIASIHNSCQKLYYITRHISPST
ncbi:hypothetical protein CVS40_2588 [Lucilia cuprina]|nr:hypothetical protein CVS40_2588 [Lucilia cuprina]